MPRLDPSEDPEHSESVDRTERTIEQPGIGGGPTRKRVVQHFQRPAYHGIDIKISHHLHHFDPSRSAVVKYRWILPGSNQVPSGTLWECQRSVSIEGGAGNACYQFPSVWVLIQPLLPGVLP